MARDFDFTQALQAGAVVDDRVGNNVLSLESVKGLKATQFGLSEFGNIRTPFVRGPVWPFPQLFRGKGVTLLADEKTVYLVDETDWTLTPFDTYQFRDHTAGDIRDAIEPIRGIKAAWKFVDFHTTWFLFNGHTQVFKVPFPYGGAIPSTALAANEAFIQDDYENAYLQPGGSDGITIRTGCDFRGRMITAGFDEDNYWSDWTLISETEWEDDYLTTLMGKYGFALTAPGKNWVGYSAIGGGDILNVFDVDFAVQNVFGFDAEYTVARPRFLEQARQLTSGYMPMDWQGAVLNTSPLRDHVMVFGEDGISAITPHTNPHPVFGLEEHMLRQGVANRSAVGGNRNRLIFIDVHGTLWSVDNKLKLERIGFERVFMDMVDDDILISHDPDFDEVYISGREKTYCLTQSGLSEVHQKVGCLYQGLYEGYYDLIGVGSPSVDSFELKTSPFSFGRAFTLNSLELNSMSLSNVEAKVYSRFSSDAEFDRRATVMVEPNGLTTFSASGVEFYVEIKGSVEQGGKMTGLALGKSRRLAADLGSLL